MKPVLAVSLAAALLSGSAWSAADAQTTTDRISGAWRVAEVTRTDESGKRRTLPAQPGLYLFTARHYSITRVDSEQPRPDVPSELTHTADSYRDIWGPFAAQAGTYRIEGDRMTTRPLVAKNPSVMRHGNANTYTWRVIADTLWLRHVGDRSGPVRDGAIHKLVRAEH